MAVVALPQRPLAEDGLPALVAPFAVLRAGLPGARHAWVARFRSAGLAAFNAAGLPTRRAEAWKYTDLQRLAKAAFGPAPAGVGPVEAPASVLAAPHRMVFVNGVLRSELSRLDALPAGIRLASLASLLDAGDPWLAERLGRLTEADGHPFAGLNAALTADGAVLHLAAGAALDEPIRLALLAGGGDAPFAVFPRLLVVAEAGSRATLVEEHHGAGGPYLSVGVAEVSVGDGARLRHYVAQDAGERAVHLSRAVVRIGRDAAYDGFALTRGAELSRAEVDAVLEAPGGDARVSGVYLARRAQHVDNTTRIEHAAPAGRSRQVFKGALDDRARGVFQGKVVVRRGAQKTDGHQLSRALLLSPQAEMDAKPELEIYADDVKCSHGATAGEIDRQALFYLRSRGIGQEEARALLIEAFLAEAVETVEDETVRAEFAGRVGEWLAARRAEGGEA